MTTISECDGRLDKLIIKLNAQTRTKNDFSIGAPVYTKYIYNDGTFVSPSVCVNFSSGAVVKFTIDTVKVFEYFSSDTENVSVCYNPQPHLQYELSPELKTTKDFKKYDTAFVYARVLSELYENYMVRCRILKRANL